MSRRFPAWLDWRIPAVIGGAVIIVASAAVLDRFQRHDTHVTHITRITRVVHPKATAQPHPTKPGRPVVIVRPSASSVAPAPTTAPARSPQPRPKPRPSPTKTTPAPHPTPTCIPTTRICLPPLRGT